ncbi:MAG: hypothetical protein M9887_03675 [Chitinophagales bacterium]|nr:hypothetical protein [Chitinophagales bacterium]
MNIKQIILFITLFSLTACRVENMEDIVNTPKDDFNTFDYVMATEDASDVDITTFFSFNLKDIDPEKSYDLIDQNDIFTNSNPSTSSGHESMHQYLFSMAKDKKGYSSTPGLYRLTLNTNNQIYIENDIHIAKNNLFPARQLCIVNDNLGYFYDEGKAPQSLQIFNPSAMVVTGSIDLKPAIAAMRPDAKWIDESFNNLIRVGSNALEYSNGKLYANILFMEAAGYNLVADTVDHIYIATIDVATQSLEKISSLKGGKTIGFFVSENKPTTVDEDGNVYFCSWGWNQFNEGNPSFVCRVKSGENEFDQDWKIDIEKLFGKDRIAQSIISYNGKIYLHTSENPYQFAESDASPDHEIMNYYMFDPAHPDQPIKLDIPSSNSSPRMNVFSIVNDKLFIAVPNIQKDKFNGYYSIDRSGHIEKEISIANKYRPTRLYRLKK